MQKNQYVIFFVKYFKKKLQFYRVLILPLVYLNRIKFIGNRKHDVKLHQYNESLDLRDRDLNDERVDYFTKKDFENGHKYPEEMGLKKDDKYVCLLCRDSHMLMICLVNTTI